MECNLISFLGEFWTPMKLNKYLKVGTAGFPNRNLSCPATNQQVCEHALLKWKGKDRLDLLADDWAGPWGGKKYKFELRQKRKLIPCHNLLTHEHLLKSSYCECLSCKMNALHGATFILIAWLLMESFWIYCGLKGLSKGTLVKISFNLQSEYSYLCLGSSRKRRSLVGWGVSLGYTVVLIMPRLQVWSLYGPLHGPCGSFPTCNILMLWLAVHEHLKCLNTCEVLLCFTHTYFCLCMCIPKWCTDRSDFFKSMLSIQFNIFVSRGAGFHSSSMI